MKEVKNGNEYIITKENIAENTSFEYTVTDEQGNTQTKTAVINTIDKNPPADFTITAENTEEGLKITGTTTDAESGIDKYEYYVMKSTESNYTKYDNNPITRLASGIYNVYVIAYDKAGNQKQSTNTEEVKISRTYSNVTAKMVSEHPETYYGLKVTNYESQNGQNDWRIFYSDWKEKSKQQNTNEPTDTHIFLITGDCIKETDKIDEIVTATGMRVRTSFSNYNMSWYSVPSFQTIDSIILTRFKATEYELQSVANSKCISTLLNVDNWSDYKDSDNKAESVIGGPTIEMWEDSWNERYPKDKVYRKAGTKGYFIDTNLDDDMTSCNFSLSSKDGYNNNLYFPKKIEYLLASPSAGSNTYVLYVASSIGFVTYQNYDYNAGFNLRPVVSLKDRITVNAVDFE